MLYGHTHDRCLVYPERTGGACSGNSSLSAVLCQDRPVVELEELLIPKAARHVADSGPGH